MNVLNGKISLTLRFGAIVVALLLGQQAMAAGTAAGTEIKNTANVEYKVGGVDQPDEPSNEVLFVVDRRVDFTLDPVNTDDLEGVSPGEQNAYVDFVLENTSNSALDFTFLLDDVATGIGVDNSGSDDANMDNLEYAVFTAIPPATAVPSDGAALADDLAADGIVYIRVWGDADLALLDGAIAGVELTATAVETDGTALSYGQTATDGGVENVAADADNDGVEVSIDGFLVNGAVISVDKGYEVIDDGIPPLGPGTEEYAVPGAIIEYTITVSNASTTAPATDVVISDVLDSDLDFVVGSILVNGAACVAADTCAFSDPNITASGPSFTVPVASVGGPGELVLTFRATIVDTP